MERLGVKLGALVLGVSAAVQGSPAAAVPAFPGAEGYGASAKGGRGGAVIEVTNLDDGGAGSLRACVSATGPRTCVFRVGGTITLSSPITVNKPYLTIAGQTAPGGGIQLRRSGTADGAPLYLENTHDIIVRHIRSRPGTGSDTDGISIDNSQKVILDHVSLYWGTDENLGASGALVEDVTVQNSILAEGLNPHSKGFLACNGGGTTCRRITSYRNLYALNNDRNPNIDMTDSVFEMYNDVVYGAGSEYAEIHDSAGGSRANIVNSYFKKASFGNSTCAIVHHPETGRATARIYVAGNRLDLVPCLADADARAAMVGVPVAPVPAGLVPAATAYAEVLQRAGAWPRDAADTRIVGHVANRTGAVPSAVTGFPALVTGSPYPDADHDGMGDTWESNNGLNPANPADRNGDRDGDGYTNLEEFLATRAAAALAAR